MTWTGPRKGVTRSPRSGPAMAWIAALWLALAACAGGPTDPHGVLLSITSDRSRYAPGEPVLVTIRNISARELAQNLCAGDFQHWDGTVWNTELGRACTLDSPTRWRPLPPGVAVRDTFPTPTVLPVGPYRVLYHIEDEDGILLSVSERASNRFEMR